MVRISKSGVCPRFFAVFLALLLALFLALSLDLLGTLCCNFAQAQSNSPLSIEVKPKSGAKDEQFLLSVTIAGDAPDVAPNLIPSNDFSSSYLGPQSSVMIINGRVSRTTAYVYALTPLREGALKSPGAELTYGGSTWSAAPQTIVVGPADSKSKGSEQITMQQSVSEKSVFRGQQVVINAEISSAERMYNPQLTDLTVDGAWIEALGKPTQTQRYIRGVPTDIITVRSSAFPLRTGSLAIPARELQAQIRQSNGARNTRGASPFSGFDPFGDGFLDDFFGSGRLTPIVVRSNELKIEVLELPPAPNGISPIAVGETRVSAAIDRAALATGETAKLTVQVTSTGNLNPLKVIDLTTPLGVKIYPQRPQSNSSEHSGLLWSRKSFVYSIVPLQPGPVNLVVPAFRYFDPTTKQYQVTPAQSVTLQVSGEAIESGLTEQIDTLNEQETQVAATPTPSTQEPLGTPTPTPIVYEEPSRLEKLAQRVAWQSLALALCILFGLGTLLALVYRQRAARIPYRRYIDTVRAANDARELLRALSTYIQSDNPEGNLDYGIEPLRIAARARSARSTKPAAARVELLELEAILDELEIAIYGDSALTENQLMELRRRMSGLGDLSNFICNWSACFNE